MRFDSRQFRAWPHSADSQAVLPQTLNELRLKSAEGRFSYACTSRLSHDHPGRISGVACLDSGIHRLLVALPLIYRDQIGPILKSHSVSTLMNPFSACFSSCCCQPRNGVDQQFFLQILHPLIHL